MKSIKLRKGKLEKINHVEQVGIASGNINALGIGLGRWETDQKWSRIKKIKDIALGSVIGLWVRSIRVFPAFEVPSHLKPGIFSPKFTKFIVWQLHNIPR